MYLCAREWRTPEQLAGGPPVPRCSNIQRRGMISRLTAAGGVHPQLSKGALHGSRAGWLLGAHSSRAAGSKHQLGTLCLQSESTEQLS